MRSDIKAASLWEPGLIKAAREALTKRAEAPVGVLRVDQRGPQNSQSAQNQENAGGKAGSAAERRVAADQGTPKTAAPYHLSSTVTVQGFLPSVGYSNALAKAAVSLMTPKDWDREERTQAAHAKRLGLPQYKRTKIPKGHVIVGGKIVPQHEAEADGWGFDDKKAKWSDYEFVSPKKPTKENINSLEGKLHFAMGRQKKEPEADTLPKQLAKQAVCETILGMARSSAGDGSKKPKEEGQLNGEEAWKGIKPRKKIGS